MKSPERGQGDTRDVDQPKRLTSSAWEYAGAKPARSKLRWEALPAAVAVKARSQPASRRGRGGRQ